LGKKLLEVNTKPSLKKRVFDELFFGANSLKASDGFIPAAAAGIEKISQKFL
jgi:hypothetical protein